MKRRNIIIIGILLAGLVVGLIVLKWVFKPAETDVGSKKADLEISATELASEFTNYEETSYENYLNKIIIVEGVIDKISEENNGLSIYLKGPQDAVGVLCSFEKKPDLSGVTAGNNIKIKGVCSGYLLDVVLNRCSIVQ